MVVVTAQGSLVGSIGSEEGFEGSWQGLVCSSKDFKGNDAAMKIVTQE